MVRRTALAEGIAAMSTKPVLHGNNRLLKKRLRWALGCVARCGLRPLHFTSAAPM